MNLANAYSDRIRGDKAENIEAAIDAYQQALQVMTRQAMPADYLRTARGLGRVLFDQARYSEALAHLQAVLATVEQMYEAAPTPTSRQSLLQELGDTPQRLAFALCRIDGVDGSRQAVVVLEQNRARWLREALEMGSARPANVPAALWSAFQTQAQRVRELQAEAQLPDHTPGRRTFLALSALLATARADLSAAVDAIRAVAPDFLPKPTFAEIQSAAQDGPLVYLLATAAGGLALIVHGGESHKPSFSEKLGLSGLSASVEAVWLDGLTEARLREWLVGPANDLTLGSWLGAYQSSLVERTPAARQRWHDVIDDTLRTLWDAAMGPVVAALARHSIPQSPNLQSPVTLIPSGLLALLPLHAAWTDDVESLPGSVRGVSRAVENRTYVMDCFTVAYAPSATALRHAQAVAATAGVDALLVVDEPKPVNASPLPNSAAEAAAIADLFTGAQMLRHAAATREATLERLAAAQVAHFSCHGNTDWQDALQSGLAMAHDVRLTVGDLLDRRLPGARLITLSACETGIVGAKLPDETVALPAALTQAGFAGVVASLWSVYDISTAMLMVRFYELWREEGMAPPAALAAAQRWVRDTTNAEKAAHFVLPGGAKMPATVAEPFFEAVFAAGDGDERTFAHPVWWAAFCYTGV
jgi:CHAT domain-containing protein